MISILSIIFLIAIALVIRSLVIPAKKWVQILLAFGTIVALALPSSLPAFAASNSVHPILEDSALSSNQNPFRFEENVCVSPTGDQFSGLCIAQEQTGLQSEAELLQAVQSKVSKENNLKVKVDNGAVLLSGSVKDEETARTVIKEIETIPGIQWITVELAIPNRLQI